MADHTRLFGRAIAPLVGSLDAFASRDDRGALPYYYILRDPGGFDAAIRIRSG